MSMARGCIVVIEREPCKWWAVVAHRKYDYDFIHGHSVYGPARSAKLAVDLVREHEANPGSERIVSYRNVRKDHLLLIDTAEHVGTSRSKCGPW